MRGWLKILISCTFNAIFNPRSQPGFDAKGFSLFTPEEFDRIESRLRRKDSVFEDFAGQINATLIRNCHNIPNRFFEWITDDGLTRMIQLSGVANDPSSKTGLSSRACAIGIVVTDIKYPLSNGFRFNPQSPPGYMSEFCELKELPSDDGEMFATLNDAYDQGMAVTREEMK